MKKRRFLRKGLKSIGVSAFLLFTIQATAAAGGPFGPPQPLSKEGGGLVTAFGYWHHEENYQNGKEQAFRQNQVYSQLGYGNKNWAIYGRIGVSDLTISDAFRSALASTVTSENNFEDKWIWFGTLGAKGFYPINKTFGIGSFIQGSCYFTDFANQVSGTSDGAPFEVRIKVSNLWDVNFGLSLQATVPYGIRFYLGPYARYSEAKASLSNSRPDLISNPGSFSIQNGTKIGGFGGIDLPLGRGFHLNVEGQYSDRGSLGASVAYTY
jgi:hypothetical protein